MLTKTDVKAKLGAYADQSSFVRIRLPDNFRKDDWDRDIDGLLNEWEKAWRRGEYDVPEQDMSKLDVQDSENASGGHDQGGQQPAREL